MVITLLNWYFDKRVNKIGEWLLSRSQMPRLKTSLVAPKWTLISSSRRGEKAPTKIKTSIKVDLLREGQGHACERTGDWHILGCIKILESTDFPEPVSLQKQPTLLHRRLVLHHYLKMKQTSLTLPDNMHSFNICPHRTILGLCQWNPAEDVLDLQEEERDQSTEEVVVQDNRSWQEWWEED